MLVGKKRSTNAVRQKTSRVWPLDELRAHPAKRFLFITDGTVEQSLSSLVVTEPAFASRPVSPNGLPKVLADDANDIRARVGVLQKTSQEIVQTRSMSILARTFFVPYSRRGECFQLIVERIRAGLLDAKQSRVQAAELETIARSCGGLPASLSNFVEHAEFSKISKQLIDSYALVLLGSPGASGTAAQVLPDSVLKWSGIRILRVGTRDGGILRRDQLESQDFHDLLRQVSTHERGARGAGMAPLTPAERSVTAPHRRGGSMIFAIDIDHRVGDVFGIANRRVTGFSGVRAPLAALLAVGSDVVWARARALVGRDRVIDDELTNLVVSGLIVPEATASGGQRCCKQEQQ